MKYLFSILSVFCLLSLNSQIVIDPTPTAVDMVTNTLIGPGLVTSNITFVGNTNQIGTFDAGTSNIGLPSGIVMSSGNVTTIVAGGNPSTDFGGLGDADVLATAQSVTSNPNAAGISSTNDAAILEFDFVPNGDVVVFNFTFASEEYLTWINSQYNDAFGFYISGPNPAGGNYASDNLALVPGTNEPITISTIYVDGNQTPPSMNAQYFLDNPIGHSFNGFTIPIEIRFDVICDSTYHFKFAVADCVDGILDTGVFLEGGSFQAIPVDLSLETNIDASLFGDSVIFEGCGTDADFVFSRPSCQSGDSLYVAVDIAGIADNGVDYSLIPDSVLFLPGETLVIIPFTAFQDGVFEGYEDVIVTVTNILPNGDTIITTGTIWLFDQPNVSVDAQDTTIYCLQDSLDIFAVAYNGVPPYTYTWSNSNDTIGITTVPANVNGTIDYYVNVVDFCGFTDDDTLTVTVNQTLAIEANTFQNTSSCDNTGIVNLVGTEALGLTNADDVNGNSQDEQYWYVNEDQSDSVNASVWGDVNGLGSGWYYVTVTDFITATETCSVTDSTFVEMDNPPIAEFSANIESGCNPMVVNFTNTSQNTSNYIWNFGDGTPDVNANNLAAQGHTFTQSSTVTLTATTNDPNCLDVATINISIVNCGCTDPGAVNYDPTAIVDDGNCVFPIPTVTAPNVFTPNSDDNNDIFFLTHQYATSIQLVVLNRWGNVMHESTTDLTDPAARAEWDGKTKGGINAEEGTYFYKYVATGVDGTEIEGHGFVQLLP